MKGKKEGRRGERRKKGKKGEKEGMEGIRKVGMKEGGRKRGMDEERKEEKRRKEEKVQKKKEKKNQFKNTKTQLNFLLEVEVLYPHDQHIYPIALYLFSNTIKKKTNHFMERLSYRKINTIKMQRKLSYPSLGFN